MLLITVARHINQGINKTRPHITLLELAFSNDLVSSTTTCRFIESKYFFMDIILDVVVLTESNVY